MHTHSNYNFYKRLLLLLLLVFFVNTSFSQSQNGCPNADFSLNNFGNWTGRLGSCCPISLPTIGFMPTRHTLIFSQATDPNTGNQLQMIPPGFTRSARLGNNVSGCQAEGLSYTIAVDSSNALFIYSYAVVLSDPGHPKPDQPRFEIEVLDPLGNPISCTYYQVASANNIPGFNDYGSIHWKNWEQVGVNLLPYFGQTITFNVRTGDCGYCGHWGYGYIAAKCYPLLVDITYCIGDTVAVLVAPNGFTDYLWSTGDTTKNITIYNPATNTDTITVTMTSVSGCVVTLSVELEPAVIVPNFNYNPKCDGEVQFTNTSTVNYGYLQGWHWDFGDGDTSNVSNPSHTYNSPGTYNVTLKAITNGGCFEDTIITITVPPPVVAGFTINYDTCGYTQSFTDTTNANNIVGWNWDFGDFTYSTQQNPTKSYYYPGTFTVRLIVTTDSGCTDTAYQQILINSIPNAIFTTSNVCDGNAVTFNNTSYNASGINSWYWDFGDNSTSNQQTPTHLYASDSTYQITLIITGPGPCSDTATANVTVNPTPVANFILPNNCGLTQTFTDSSNIASGNIISWFWNFGDGDTSTLQNPTHTYAQQGTYNVQLIVTSDSGCVDTITLSNYVYGQPVAGFSTNNVCQGSAATFTDTTTATYQITNWYWNFGDNTTSTQQNPTHQYASPGTYIVTLIAGSQCSDTATGTITIYPSPTADFTVSSNCGLTKIFSDSSNTSIGNIVNWNWNFGDNNTSAQQNPTHTYAQFGNYNVTLIVTSNNGCTDTIVKPIIVNLPPVAGFAFTSTCDGFSMSFTDTSNSNVALNSWYWDFGDNTTSTLQNPTHLYPSAGTYNVMFVVGYGQCSDTVYQNVTVQPLPVANYVLPNLCGFTQSFTDNSTISSGSITNWNWDFGDNTTSTQQNPTHTYTQSGAYPVTLIATSDSGCTDTIVQTLNVYSIPTAAFTTGNVCDGQTVSFTDNSTNNNDPINSWNWDFGDNTTSTQQNPTHTYNGPGTYTVQLIVTGPGNCSDTVSSNVVVHPNPVANYVLPNLCGFTQSFTDNSTISSGSITNWNWDFGDNTTSTQQNPTHTYTQSGAYPVTLIATSDSGCTDTIVQTLNVYSIPTAAFTTGNVCDGQTVSFTDNSTNNNDPINSWNWDFGDNTTSTQQNPTHTYNGPGTYIVQLIVTGPGNCSDTISSNIIVYPKPVAGIILPDSCGLSFNFTDNSTISSGNINTWLWDFGDNTTSNQQNPSHTYSNFGTWTIQIIVTSNFGCTDTATTPFTNLEIPIADFTATDVCLGDSTAFTDLSNSQTSSIQTWNWNFQSGNSNLQNPNFVFPGYGNTNVTLIVTSNNGCIDTVTKPINVFALPNVQFSFNDACVGDPVQFTNQTTIPVGSISNYNWNLSNSTSSQTNPSSVYTNYGNYTIQLTAISNNGCVDSATQPLQIHPIPQIAFTAAPLQGCVPLLVTFTNNSSIVTGNIASYLWSFGNGASSTNINPIYIYNTAGTYSVTLTATSAFGCDSTLTLTNLITVYPQPDANFTYIPEDIDISNPQVSFDNQSNGAISYNWNFGDGGSSTDVNPLHLYSDTGNFTVKLIAENKYGCLDTAHRPLLVKASFALFIPNSFTPNRDGLNDYFKIYGIGISEVEVLIFDRWGELLCEMDKDLAMQKGWNGFYKNIRAKQDVYIYKVSIVDIHGKRHSFMGNINLIR